MRHLKRHSVVLLKQFCLLAIDPLFIVLTFFGNILVFTFATAFYYSEFANNPDVNEAMDAIWWAFTTVTTVGFGDIVPVTTTGRILGIILMLLGTAIFACYVALITEVFLATDLKDKKFRRKKI